LSRLSAEKRLEEFLSEGKAWDRMPTSIPGVFVLKLPPYKSQPSHLVVELNPVDSGMKPTKRRGLVLRSVAELEAFNELYQPERIGNLLTMLEGVNPEGPKRRGKTIEL
jgi:hypothetical protein